MKLILAAVDGSSRAPQVLKVAAELATTLQAKLVLLRAVGIPGDLPSEAFTVSPDDLVGVLQERARRELDKLLLAASVESTETRVVVGTAWKTICRVAREDGAAMIVVGSHGYGGIDRLLGTTAARVVNHADCSVLVVRAPERLALAQANPPTNP